LSLKVVNSLKLAFNHSKVGSLFTYSVVYHLTQVKNFVVMCF